jgi:hypothetical protein
VRYLPSTLLRASLLNAKFWTFFPFSPRRVPAADAKRLQVKDPWHVLSGYAGLIGSVGSHG